MVLRCELMRIVSASHWRPLSGLEDKPENNRMVTYALTDDSNQTTLTLTHRNRPSQQDADNMVELGWKPVL